VFVETSIEQIQTTSEVAETSVLTNQMTSVVAQTPRSYRPVSSISPLPVIGLEEKSRKRKSRAAHAADLTSTPYKQQLEQMPVNIKRAACQPLIIAPKKQKIRRMQPITKTMKGQKKTIVESDSSDGENMSGSKSKESEEEQLDRVITYDFNIGKWVIVKYDSKSRTKFYVGKITNLNQNDTANGKFEIKFLRRSTRTNNNFRDSLPQEQSVDDVDEDDIVTSLPDPSVRRGIYNFKYDFSPYDLE
jgi:hypothetical protein